MTLFIHCYSKGHEALQVTALHILCDMLATHTTILTPVTQPDGETVTPPVFQKPLFKAFVRALRANSPTSVQTAAAGALSKLLLTSTFTPSGPNVPPAIQELNQSAIDTLLQSLVASFFHPRTRENPALRQTLAYFFPVYCHSRITNTQCMRKIAVPVIRVILNAAEEYYSLEAEEDSDGDIDETVGEREIKALMTGVLGMLAEWTDERRVIGLGGERVLAGGAASSNACGWVHLALAKDILERVLGVGEGGSRCSKDEKKLMFSLLSKLYISAPAPATGSRSGSRAPEGEDQFRSSSQSGNRVEIEPEHTQLAQEVKELLDQTIDDGLAGDATSRNALVKAKNSVLKILAAAQGIRTGSARPREGSVDIESDAGSVAGSAAGSVAGSVRSGSVRPSIETGFGRRGVSIEPSIMEVDENEDENQSQVTMQPEEGD